MSVRNELIKLETMYYHEREKKHLAFLAANELYRWWRTVNTFKGGAPEEEQALQRIDLAGRLRPSAGDSDKKQWRSTVTNVG